MCILL